MDISKLTSDFDKDRRRFLGAAVLAAGAAGAGRLGVTAASGAGARAASAGHGRAAATAAGSFGPLQQIEAGVLNVGYAEAGPADGEPVILMHGFPYDIHSYVEVAPLLATAGYRVIVPYFRGYGTTTFRSPSTPRNVDQAAFALGHARADGCTPRRAGDPGRL